LYFFLEARASQADDSAQSMANLSSSNRTRRRNKHASRVCPAAPFATPN
jgi:hypothetical protein